MVSANEKCHEEHCGAMRKALAGKGGSALGMLRAEAPRAVGLGRLAWWSSQLY